MPHWVYSVPSWLLALEIVILFEVVSIGGLLLTRRYVLPHLRFHDGVNDAVGGTIQAIGVFYGITVGLIAVGVWNSYSHASDLVSQEAATIGSLYRDVSSYPEVIRGDLQTGLKSYTLSVIEQEWPAHKSGQLILAGAQTLTAFQQRLTAFEPATDGQRALHAEALRAFNQLIENRRLRMDAVTSSLSSTMWFVIWVGAAISIAVGYFFHVKDVRLHGILVGMMAGFLGIVVFLIISNDRPFMGDTSIPPNSYQLILDSLINTQ